MISHWTDYERARLLREADKRNEEARELRIIADTDAMLKRSVWAAEEAHARRSMRVLNRVCAAACIAIVTVYGWTITTKAFAIHAADVAMAQKMGEMK